MVQRGSQEMKVMLVTFSDIKGIHSTMPNSQPNLLCGDTEAVT
jgi:hypothetical protein